MGHLHPLADYYLTQTAKQLFLEGLGRVRREGGREGGLVVFLEGLGRVKREGGREGVGVVLSFFLIDRVGLARATE